MLRALYDGKDGQTDGLLHLMSCPCNLSETGTKLIYDPICHQYNKNSFFNSNITKSVHSTTEALIVEQRAAPLLGRVDGQSEGSRSQEGRKKEKKKEKKRRKPVAVANTVDRDVLFVVFF